MRPSPPRTPLAFVASSTAYPHVAHVAHPVPNSAQRAPRVDPAEQVRAGDGAAPGVQVEHLGRLLTQIRDSGTGQRQGERLFE